MKVGVIVMLAAIAAVNAHSTRADAPQLSPFVANYDVKYGSFSAGTSRTELRRTAIPGQWQIESRTTASGLARLYFDDTIVQRSTFQLEADSLRPLSYWSDDGKKRTSLDFDWDAVRVKGNFQGAPIDIPAESGLQDAASMQAFVLLRLNGGSEPGVVAMIEKDRIKYFRYTLLRREKLKTALGVFDTLVYRSARDGSARETLLWYAPALEHATVQAEQRRDGKKQLQIYIKGYRPGT